MLFEWLNFIYIKTNGHRQLFVNEFFIGTLQENRQKLFWDS